MFKRNQLEAAIRQVLEPESAKLSSEMCTRIKRLLETDRAFSRNKHSVDPERANFAFFTRDVPGRGFENWFSEYEAFALLTGLRLMQHGWPQGFAVAVLRRIKPELESHHARIMRQDQKSLFAKRRRQTPKAGDIPVDNADPVFLVVLSRNREARSGSNQAAICRGQEGLMRFIKAQEVGLGWTVFELVTFAHALSSALAKTRPHRRGRADE